MSKFRIVFTALHTSVASCHYKEFTDSSAFHGVHHFICQGCHLCMRESSDNCSVFNGYRWLTLLSMSNQCRKIFRFSVFAFGDVMCPVQAAGSCDVNTILVAGICTWRNDTVTCEQDRTVETFKFLFLLPPGVSVVSCQMLVLL